MAGSIEGGKKAAETNKKRFSSDYYSRIGKLGGSVKSPIKGFGGMDKAKHAEASSKGGRGYRPSEVKD